MEQLKAIDKTIDNMILSASGWRSVFAEDGDEESSSCRISPAHTIIIAAAAKVFSDYLSDQNGAVIVGMDTRPTGKTIAEALIRVLLSLGRELIYTGIIAAPELMAFARTNSPQNPMAGFIYISASHNPIGHNGIKFGLADGGVLQADESFKLISAFRDFMACPDCIPQAEKLLKTSTDAALREVYAREHEWKKASLAAYRNFTGEVISGFPDTAKHDDFFSLIRQGLKKHPLGIVADFNGSARTVSIDREFFSSLGVSFRAINETPGDIVHRIVPEGDSLEPCRILQQDTQRSDPSFVLGYVSDCDGDRGNLVIWDAGIKEARIIDAQEVFALACVAELSWLAWTGELETAKAALVVNDPSSLRIDQIAAFFDAQVFRAEVGEANVVGLARKLRKEGFLVRILGEGSSGGTIIHPSAVRDPIDTLGAIIKLLVIRHGEKPGLFEIWCKLSGRHYRDDFLLADIINSLPNFISTGAYTDDALLKVKTGDHGLLKQKYQQIFLEELDKNKSELYKHYGITEWEAISYNGMMETRELKNFADSGSGGLKIEFYTEKSGKKTKTAFVWMRGSGTEAVFRIMADAECRELERFLIAWQRKMVLKANKA